MTSVTYREFTGTAAENYQRYFVPAIATPVSDGLLAAADLRPGARVLDVACGTGIIARLAAERVGPTGSVTAIDLASQMIEVAKTTPAPSEPAIEWHIGDATSLPFPDDGGSRAQENRTGTATRVPRCRSPFASVRARSRCHSRRRGYDGSLAR